MPEDFRHHSDDSYFAYLGVHAKALPPGFTSEQLDTATDEHFNSLEKAINSSGRIAMTIPGAVSDKPLAVGYVEMRVEEKNK